MRYEKRSILLQVLFNIITLSKKKGGGKGITETFLFFRLNCSPHFDSFKSNVK